MALVPLALQLHVVVTRPRAQLLNADLCYSASSFTSRSVPPRDKRKQLIWDLDAYGLRINTSAKELSAPGRPLALPKTLWKKKYRFFSFLSPFFK